MEPDMKRHLFYATSHSPSLVELVGFERAQSIIDFCFIANPYYPTPAMIEELRAMLPSLIKSYPSSQPEQSQRHLAEVIHVNPDNLIIGNGASELITIIQEHLIDTIAVPVPTFSEYLEKLRDRRSAELYYLRRDKSYALNPINYLAWIRKKGLHAALIINPGNPSGQLLSLEQMREFLERAKDLDLIIVDESFIDFAGDPVPSLLPFADRHSNLLLIRSMSKHCGVPGLRLGYGYTDNLYLLNRLRRVIPTWNVNTLAEYFLSQLPATDRAYQEARLRLIDDVRTLKRELDTIPAVTAYPTGANFILVRIADGMTAGELQHELLQKHSMYVRDCSNKIGMDAHHIRIASQGREKDALLVDALRAILTR
jgi:histidinol-phosphate/aromatic aminotransferase/cobyric acid decarboxylase-like protein